MRSLKLNRRNRYGFMKGIWEHYYDDGSTHSRGTYKNNKKEGYWESYYRNGNLGSKGNYIDNKREGIFEYYWSDGGLKFKRLYENDCIMEVLPIR